MVGGGEVGDVGSGGEELYPSGEGSKCNGPSGEKGIEDAKFASVS